MPDIKELNFWSPRSHFFPREHYTPDQYLCPVCSPTSFTIPLCSCGADAGLDWTCVGAADAMSAGLSEYSVREGRERGKGTGRILRDASTVSRGREERPSTTDHALLNRKHSARMYTSKCCTSSVTASHSRAEWGDLLVTLEREWWLPVSGEVRHVSTDLKKVCAHIQQHTPLNV